MTADSTDSEPSAAAGAVGETQPLGDFLATLMRAAAASAFAETDVDSAAFAPVATANPDFGDYQCNDAMGLAKVLRRPPRAIAEAVVAKLPAHDCLARVEIAGPGFINLHLDAAWLARALEAMAADERLGLPDVGRGKTVVVDYSSPNVAKPMHIGHIRSTVIGNALDRLYRGLGYTVVADNHLGDWGTQFGILIMGFRHFLDEAAFAATPIEELERLYVKSYEQSKADESWLEQCRAELVKLQQGDAENLALWRQFVDVSMAEFSRIYDRLDVSFDLVRGESFYRDRLEQVVADLGDRGLATESRGACVVDLQDEGLEVAIVRKSDGGFNYTSSDVATVLNRVEEFSPAAIVYVTDERQQLHFKQLFAICRKLGLRTDLQHVWFGLMRLPDATFSTRDGNVIKLERLLDEAEARALELVKEASPDMPAEQQREVARAVGIGAVKYADLSQNPQSLVTFSWDKAMALNGNSAPYLQYACARIQSVLDKYEATVGHRGYAESPVSLAEPVERMLALQLLRFPETVVRAAEHYKPSMLAEYLFELAGSYSSFYQNLPFLKAEPEVRDGRVRLCEMVGRVLKEGLSLLGIETPERI